MLNEQRFNACFRRFIQDRKVWYYDLYICNMLSEERVNLAKVNFHGLVSQNPIFTMVCDADLQTCIARSATPAGVPVKASQDLFFFRDISDDPEDKKHERMERILVSLSRKQYDPLKNRMVELTIVKRNDRLYTLICAVCMQTMCIDDGNTIARYLFGNIQTIYYLPDAENLGKFTKPSEMILNNYWKRILGKMSAPPRKKQSANSQKFLYDVKALDNEHIVLIERFVRDYGLDAKSILFGIWAIIFSKFSLIPHFHIAMHVPNREMMFMPITLNLTKDSLADTLHSINEQLSESIKYSDCNEDILRRILGFHYMDACPLSFISMQSDDLLGFVDRTEEAYITYCRACIPSESNLQIGFYTTDKYIFVEYQFDPELISQTDIVSLDDSFRKMLTAFLAKMDYEKICEHVVKQNTTSKAEEVAKIARVLETNPAFSRLDAKVLATLAACCRPVSAISEDCPIETGDSLDALYLIEEGHIEMAAISKESVPQPLMILKKGDLIGLESLMTDRTAVNTYRVVDDTARLISIPSYAFIKIASEHPEMWKELLTTASGRMNRFAKMWLISS